MTREWLAMLLLSLSSPALAYTPAVKAMECTVIMGLIRNELVGRQKAGAYDMYTQMDKEARKLWWEEFPFEPYDQWALKRIQSYVMEETTPTEYAAYWELVGCGRSPWVE